MEQFESSIDRVLSIMNAEWDYDPLSELTDDERPSADEDSNIDVSCLDVHIPLEKQHICPYCQCRQGDTVEFRNHVVLKHSNQYHCLRCTDKSFSLFDSRTECYAHINAAHGIKGPQAQSLTQSVAKHLLTETIQQFRLNSKLHTYPGANNAPRGASSHPVLTCELCKTYQTDSAASYVAHRMAHKNLRRFQCPICGLRANFRSNVRKHINSRHRDCGSGRRIVVLSEQEARSTILKYLESQKSKKGFNAGSPPDLAILPDLKCSFCRFKTVYSQVLKLHCAKAHRCSPPVKRKAKHKICFICKKHRAACNSRARLHWALNHLRRPVRIACGKCRLPFTDLKLLFNHWQNMHSKLSNKDQTCVIVFRRL